MYTCRTQCQDCTHACVSFMTDCNLTFELEHFGLCVLVTSITRKHRVAERWIMSSSACWEWGRITTPLTSRSYVSCWTRSTSHSPLCLKMEKSLSAVSCTLHQTLITPMRYLILLQSLLCVNFHIIIIINIFKVAWIMKLLLGPHRYRKRIHYIG